MSNTSIEINSVKKKNKMYQFIIMAKNMDFLSFEHFGIHFVPWHIPNLNDKTKSDNKSESIYYNEQKFSRYIIHIY